MKLTSGKVFIYRRLYNSCWMGGERLLPVPERLLLLSETFLPVPERFLPVPERFLPVPEPFLPVSERLLPLPERFLPVGERSLLMRKLIGAMLKRFVDEANTWFYTASAFELSSRST